MTLQDTMKQLEKLGTAQNRKTYARHGAGDNMFGVSFANLYALQKRIKADHALAQQLWKTGNTDARILALLVADPAQLTAAEAESWLREIRYYMATYYLAVLVAKTSFADKLMHAWMKSKQEYDRACGYEILAGRLRAKDASIPDADLKKILATIEREIHGSANRARAAMNGAMIGIGSRRALTKEAIATAKRIGPVDVDHGDTSCKTPDAAAYIVKIAKRNK